MVQDFVRTSVLSAHKYFQCILKKDNILGEAVYSESVFSDDGIARFKAILQSELNRNNQAFGDGKLYQSLPMLDIDGLRPTDIRINTYRIKDFINARSDVLDIGCNCGFFDIEISKYVHFVEGIDLNASLISIGRHAAQICKADNIQFICNDYNSWYNLNIRSYDMILSFSVHLWLDVAPKVYARQLFRILKSGGHIIFESHKIPTDSKYDMFTECFCKEGLRIVREGIIYDDHIRKRKYIIFEKQNA